MWLTGMSINKKYTDSFTGRKASTKIGKILHKMVNHLTMMRYHQGFTLRSKRLERLSQTRLCSKASRFYNKSWQLSSKI